MPADAKASIPPHPTFLLRDRPSDHPLRIRQRVRPLARAGGAPCPVSEAAPNDGLASTADAVVRAGEDEWLWGWDPTPGIVSVWAEPDGRAIVWRRIPETGALVREDERFRPWLLLDRARRPAPPRRAARAPRASPARARHLPRARRARRAALPRRADDGRALAAAVLHGASRRLGRRVGHLRELGAASVLALPPEEQYLVATGPHLLPRSRVRPAASAAVRPRDHRARCRARSHLPGRGARSRRRAPRCSRRAARATPREAELIRRLVARVQAADPDVIENHNLHGFDLPFLDRRARHARRAARARPHRRAGPAPARGARAASSSGDDADAPRALRRARARADRHARRGAAPRLLGARPAGPRAQGGRAPPRHRRRPTASTIPRRSDLRRSTGAIPSACGATPTDDVEEVAALARMLGGAAFALARMAPRRYERLADAGAATGVIDPLLVRAYLRAGAALPAHRAGRRHAAQRRGAAPVRHRRRAARREGRRRQPVSVADARATASARRATGSARCSRWSIGWSSSGSRPRRSARAAPPGSAERYTHEAMSAAMKLVVNSAYGYLAAGGELTRFADVHAANEVTRRGREMLDLMCRELAARGVTLLEADTDGVYFAVPEAWTEADERRVVAEVAALLPPLVQLEFEGRYAAMLSHEPKNYALLGYDGTLLLRGVAFRSSRAEPFGEAFLRRAIARLLAGDVAGVRDAYLDDARRAAPPRAARRCDVSSRVRLTKTPARVPRDARGRAASCRTRRCSPAAARRGASASACASIARSGGARRWSREPDDDEAAGRRATRATTTSSTTCACCATPSPRGWRARSPRTTSPPCSPSRPALALRAVHRDDAAGARHAGRRRGRRRRRVRRCSAAPWAMTSRAGQA